MSVPLPPDDLPPEGDRRKDARTREVLEKHARRTTSGVVWMRRVTVGLVVLSVANGMFLLGGGIAVMTVLDRFAEADRKDEAQQRASRIEASTDRCEQLNATNRGIRRYLRRRDPDGLREAVAEALRRHEPEPFPIEPDCRASAIASVDVPAPRPPR